VGEDQHCHYAGCSVVVDAYGKTVAQCHKNSVESLTVILDLQEQQRRRTKFRVLNDRDIL
jgi:predicted amidohydrolase